MNNNEPTKEELREAFRKETDPAKKKAIAYQALNGEVCYWEYCCKPWGKDLTGFCSEEHHDLYKKENPIPIPTKKRSTEELQQAVLDLRDRVFQKNVLREEPRQQSLDEAK